MWSSNQKTNMVLLTFFFKQMTFSQHANHIECWALYIHMRVAYIHARTHIYIYRYKDRYMYTFIYIIHICTHTHRPSYIYVYIYVCMWVTRWCETLGPLGPLGGWRLCCYAVQQTWWDRALDGWTTSAGGEGGTKQLGGFISKDTVGLPLDR